MPYLRETAMTLSTSILRFRTSFIWPFSGPCFTFSLPIRYTHLGVRIRSRLMPCQNKDNNNKKFKIHDHLKKRLSQKKQKKSQCGQLQSQLKSDLMSNWFKLQNRISGHTTLTQFMFFSSYFGVCCCLTSEICNKNNKMKTSMKGQVMGRDFWLWLDIELI